VSEAVAYVESLRGEEYRRRLFRLREGRSDEEWASLCMEIWRVQMLSATPIIEAFERMGGRGNNG
jgi:hypothetical protein